MAHPRKKIMIIAGEPSGDFIAAQLIKALKKKDPKLEFEGIGGQHMAAQGVKSLYPLSSLSIMGFFEDAGKYYGVYQKLKAVTHKITTERPDMVITVDFPGFNFRLGKMIKGSGVPHVHYVAPTVWAWKPWRAKKIAQFLNHLLCVFPFEPPYFEKENLPTTYVGHPVMEMGFDKGNAANFFKKYDINNKATVLTLLPGSRARELDKMIPVFKGTIQEIKKQVPDLHVVIPTLNDFKERLVSEDWGCDVTVLTDFEDRKDAYAASKVALAASGTIALELAAAELPMVITYKISKLSEWIARSMLKIKHVCMVNILLKASVVPELLQEDCVPDRLAPQIIKLLSQKAAHGDQTKALKKVKAMLKPGAGMPSNSAADQVLNLLNNHK